MADTYSYCSLLPLSDDAALIGTVFLLRVPGGAPTAPTEGQRPHWEEMREALRDRNFRRFLFGTAGLSIGGGMVTAFMPFPLVEKAGIQPGTAIWLDTAAMIGGIVVSLPCGWMADRFGSRTVLMPGLTPGWRFRASGWRYSLWARRRCWGIRRCRCRAC